MCRKSAPAMEDKVYGKVTADHMATAGRADVSARDGGCVVVSSMRGGSGQWKLRCFLDRRQLIQPRVRKVRQESRITQERVVDSQL